jgi:hypothetical protein
VAKFVRYLTDEGFQFAEGRGYLAKLLGVGADDRHVASIDAEEPLPVR